MWYTWTVDHEVDSPVSQVITVLFHDRVMNVCKMPNPLNHQTWHSVCWCCEKSGQHISWEYRQVCKTTVVTGYPKTHPYEQWAVKMHNCVSGLAPTATYDWFSVWHNKVLVACVDECRSTDSGLILYWHCWTLCQVSAYTVAHGHASVKLSSTHSLQ